MYRTIKPAICLYSLNLHTVPITIPVNGFPWVSQIKQSLLCPLIGAMTHGVSINLWRWEEDFSSPPPSTTTLDPVSRSDQQQKTDAWHSWIFTAERHAAIHHVYTVLRVHWSWGCQSRRAAAYSKSSAKTFSLQTPTTLGQKKKKIGEVGEINQAYSGRDNKFAANIEYGNPICLVPHFHGKAIPFSGFQRPPKSAMISSFRSNWFKNGNLEKSSSRAEECCMLQTWKTHLVASSYVCLAPCSICLVNIVGIVNTCAHCSTLIATAYSSLAQLLLWFHLYVGVTIDTKWDELSHLVNRETRLKTWCFQPAWQS